MTGKMLENRFQNWQFFAVIPVYIQGSNILFSILFYIALFYILVYISFLVGEQYN